MPLLTHRFHVPESPQDPTLYEAWQRVAAAQSLGPPSAPPPPSPPSPPSLPPSTQMWEAVLEQEALDLHKFLQRGSLPDVTPLSSSPALQALSSSAHGLGLLIFSHGAPASLRGYHLRRLARVASRFSPIRCEEDARDGATADVTSATDQRGASGWPFVHLRCDLNPPDRAWRFAHANASTELSGMLASGLGLSPTRLLAALPTNSAELLQAGAASAAAGSSSSSSRQGGATAAANEHVRFAILFRGDPPEQWQAQTLEAPVSEAAIASLVEQHVDQRQSASRTDSAQPQGRKEEL